MVTQEDPNEFLEEVVKSYGNVYFPHLRTCTEKFVDIVNHPMTQQKMSEKFKIPTQNICQPIVECINETSLYDKLVCLKGILSKSDTVPDPPRMLTKLQNIGLSGVLSGDDFDFLQSDELSLDGRVNKFLRFIEEDESQNRGNDQKKAFDEYTESWKRNRQKWGWSQSKIQEAECKLREEFDSATIDNSKSLEMCLSEISETCEPLRKKLVQVDKTIEHTSTAAGVLAIAFNVAATVAAGPLGLVFLPLLYKGTKVLTKMTLNKTTIYGSRSADKEWFGRTSQFIKKYLRGEVTNDILKEFIQKEQLEPDLDHFNYFINPWLSDLKQNIERLTPKSFCLDKDLIMKEIERISEYLYAVILNKPEMLKKHQHVLDGIIQDPGRLHDVQSSHFLYPLVSFGQLPLPSRERKRVVKFQFVLDNTLSEQDVNNVLNELEHIFSNITTKRTTLHGNIPVIELDLHIEDNVTTCVAQLIKKLADLKVRSILIGEFGLGGFRHAMNPVFNRTYSVKCVDRAEGFIPTYYTDPLDRGGEPYFCPIGWRRYSIDVGLTGTQFESKYGDWPVAYHGTEGHIAMSILLNGVSASGNKCFISNGEGAVYLSPSIEYCGHPRYARVWKVKSKYVQMVLQVRVSPTLIFDKKEGTLPGAFKNDPPMDKNFEGNKRLEWVIKWPPETHMKAANGILIYGIMLRVTNDHPGRLPHNKWWEGCRLDCWDFF